MTKFNDLVKKAVDEQYPNGLTEHQKFLRKNQPVSEPEEALAFYLVHSGAPKFERNGFITGTAKKWEYDFIFRPQRIILEVHGAVFTQGRHVQGVGFTEDRRKMNMATKLGWKVYEFTTEQITTGEALEFVMELF